MSKKKKISYYRDLILALIESSPIPKHGQLRIDVFEETTSRAQIAVQSK